MNALAKEGFGGGSYMELFKDSLFYILLSSLLKELIQLMMLTANQVLYG
jgi:hypothetical protein